VGFSLVTAPVGDGLPLRVPEAVQRTIMLPLRQRFTLPVVVIHLDAAELAPGGL
jgi:hypothetical protein